PLLVVAALTACGTPAPGPRAGSDIDVDRALAFVHELAAAGPRVASTPGGARAVQRIERALADSGVAVERLEVGTVDIPAITVLGRTFRRARVQHVREPNLVARFGGRGPALVVMAH